MKTNPCIIDFKIKHDQLTFYKTDFVKTSSKMSKLSSKSE